MKKKYLVDDVCDAEYSTGFYTAKSMCAQIVNEHCNWFGNKDIILDKISKAWKSRKDLEKEIKEQLSKTFRRFRR